MAVQGLQGRGESPRALLVMAPVSAWIGAWVWLCSWVVWTYRRRVPELAASDDPYDQAAALRHAEVTTQYTLRDLTGVELAGLSPTRTARFVNGQWPLVGHAAAIGMVVIAIAWLG